MSQRAALETLARGLNIMLTGVKQLLEAPDPDEWVDQNASPLGRRKHCALAREGALEGARKHQGHWLVRRRVIDAYIESHGGGPPPAAVTENEEDAEILAFRAPPKKGRG